MPYINDALAAHPALATSINTLRGAGVTMTELDPRPTPEALPWAELLPDRN